MANYLVTGGCGFIGSHLGQALVERGHGVRILDDLSTGRRDNAPDGAEIIVGDVRAEDMVADAMAGMDGCFHLAAIASVPLCQQDPLRSHAVNQGGSLAVFDAAARAQVPVVYASSAAVYGHAAPGRITEAAPTLPLSVYGVDKLGSEMHARVASLSRGVPTVGMRFFNVYGPGQDPKSPYSGVISIFCDRMRAHQAVTVFGDGEQVRDFIYVGDVVRYLMAAMDRPAPRPMVFNVCSGTPTTIGRLAEATADVLGVRPEIRFAPPRDGDIRFSLGDGTAAIRYFGIAPETSLGDGLARTLR